MNLLEFKHIVFNETQNRRKTSADKAELTKESFQIPVRGGEKMH